MIPLISHPIIVLNVANTAGRFGRPYNLGICAALGGLQRHAQVKELQAGSEIAVCTPGRWIDLLKVKGGTNCQRVTYLVLDEADRMFDMGFGHQVCLSSGFFPPFVFVCWLVSIVYFERSLEDMKSNKEGGKNDLNMRKGMEGKGI